MTPRGFEPLFTPSGAIKNAGSEQAETAVTQPASVTSNVWKAVLNIAAAYRARSPCRG